MFKKSCLLMGLSIILILPASTFSTETSTANMRVAMKIAHPLSVITLASNDIAQMQNSTSKSVATTKSESNDATESTNLPAQAWFILAALLCFVMRSSRRVV